MSDGPTKSQLRIVKLAIKCVKKLTSNGLKHAGIITSCVEDGDGVMVAVSMMRGKHNFIVRQRFDPSANVGEINDGCDFMLRNMILSLIRVGTAHKRRKLDDDGACDDE